MNHYCYKVAQPDPAEAEPRPEEGVAGPGPGPGGAGRGKKGSDLYQSVDDDHPDLQSIQSIVANMTFSAD